MGARGIGDALRGCKGGEAGQDFSCALGDARCHMMTILLCGRAGLGALGPPQLQCTV